jgi:hypothetical protein
MASMSRRQLIEISAELNASANWLFRGKTQCSGVKNPGQAFDFSAKLTDNKNGI